MLQLIVDFTSVVMCYVFGIVDFHTIIERCGVKCTENE